MEKRGPGAIVVLAGGAPGRGRLLLKGAAWVAALIVGWTALLTALEAVFYPWAFAFPGGSKLPGAWYAEVRTGSAEAHLVELRLRARGLNRRPGRTTILGTARVCGPGGSLRRFDLHGETRNWRGTSVYLSMTNREGPREGREWRLAAITGQWDGPAIEADAEFFLLDTRDGAAHARAQATRGNTGPPGSSLVVPATFQRGRQDDFEARCAARQAGARPIGR